MIKYTHLRFSIFTVLNPVDAVIAEFEFKSLYEKCNHTSRPLGGNSCYFSQGAKINLKQELNVRNVNYYSMSPSFLGVYR